MVLDVPVEPDPCEAGVVVVVVVDDAFVGVWVVAVD